MRSALLIVDVQKDFCPGGALAVSQGDRIIPILNRWIADFVEQGAAIYVSRDWHPRVTRHFKESGGLWPPHCIAGTEGAEFHNNLRVPPAAIIISKGQNPDEHGYSAFEGRTPAGSLLIDDLRDRGVEGLYVGGLATDYCVKHSVLDARRAGLQVTVIGDAIAGVDVRPGDSARAIEEMSQAGAAFLPRPTPVPVADPRSS